MMRGDVYFLRYDNTVGAEMGIGRSVVVVSSNEYLENSSVVQVLYMTTSPRERSQSVKLTSDINGQPRLRVSFVVCDQIHTIDKMRLEKPQYRVTDEEMSQIDSNLSHVLGIKCENVVVSDDGYELDKYKRLYNRALSELVALNVKSDCAKMKVSL